jgi:hypothetical protein
MTLRDKGKRNKTSELRTARVNLTQKMVPRTAHSLMTKSGSAPMKSISSVAGSRAMTSTIGCKPNASSTVRRLQIERYKAVMSESSRE